MLEKTLGKYYKKNLKIFKKFFTRTLENLEFNIKFRKQIQKKHYKNIRKFII